VRLYTAGDMARELAWEAASRRVDELHKAWDQEIEAVFAALRERAKLLDQEKRTEGSQARRELAQEAADRALAGAVTSYLEGLAAQAQGNDASAVTIPTGFRAASLVLAGPPVAEIQALLGDILTDVAEGASDDPTARARQSAIWALGQGLSPHGEDVAEALRGSKLDPEWAERFSQLAERLTALEGPSSRLAQLEAYRGGEKLDLLKAHVGSLQAYGSERLLTALGRPEKLAGTSAPRPGPLVLGRGAAMPGPAFHAMLDGLFK
jgi:hypothetical protein